MIRKQEFFDGSLPAGFDGVFDWDLLSQQVFPRFSKEDFMDIDAVMEKNGRFLHFETKSALSNIPTGQQITMWSYHDSGLVTYIIIHFETEEKDLNKINRLSIWFPNDDKPKTYKVKELSYTERFNLLVKLVKQWRQDAEAKGKLTKKEIPPVVVEKIIEKQCECITCKIKRQWLKIWK